MKTWKRTASQRNLRGMFIPFAISIVIFVLVPAPGFGEDPKTGIGLDDFDKAAVRELRSVAAGAALALNVYMSDRVTDMLVWSEVSGPLKKGLTEPKAGVDATRALAQCLKISGVYEAITLLDKNGLCLASAPEGLVNENFADNKAFKGAVQGN
jgi:hypothetical protein